jgi:hypothetical protein
VIPCASLVRILKVMVIGGKGVGERLRVGTGTLQPHGILRELREGDVSL